MMSISYKSSGELVSLNQVFGLAYAPLGFWIRGVSEIHICRDLHVVRPIIIIIILQDLSFASQIWTFNFSR